MLEILASGDGVTALAAGEVVCRYRWGPDRWKPCVDTLRLPAGPNLLEDAPADHPHHHGLWFGHGRVEGPDGRVHDLWLEREGCGRLAHTGLSTSRDGWSAEAEWRAADGGVLARDTRTFRLTLEPARLILRIEYTLSGAGIRLHGSNEAGLPHLRPAPWIAAHGGGRATDSEGRAGERGIFGREAAWVECAGTAGGATWALRVLDDPANLGRPTRWFVRDYGPFSPNDAHFDPQPRSLPLHLRYTVLARRAETVP